MKKAILTLKQNLFCIEYIKDFNATRAAKAAGYSEYTARQMGSENLSKPYIAEFIREKMEERSKKLELDAQWVLKRLKIEAQGEGQDTNSTARVRAVELVGKHLQMFTDRHHVDSGENINSTITGFLKNASRGG
jgi:phage terminase small subunit